jgi:hypothetical protein
MLRPRHAEPRAFVLLAVVTGILLAAERSAHAAEPPPRAPPAEDGAPAGGGVLGVTADPPRLVLGRHGTAELRISAPPEVEELTLTASAGRVEGVRRLSGGGFVARYRAPAERFPQVAIVAATAHGAAGPLDGWLALPLSGQGDARVKASPRQIVTLRIGDRTFGPRLAGADGLAVIPVIVPPGVREAHHGFRSVDLHVPETSLVHAVAHRATVQADRAEQVRVVAYVVAPHGAARRGDVPVLETSRGSASMTPREPGAFEVIWTLPPGPSREERLGIRLAGAPASRAAVKVAALPGPAAGVALSFDRDAFVAEDETPPEVVVTARVVDAAGNTATQGPRDLELDSDAGALSPPVEREPGIHEARLAVPPRFGSRRELLVTARAGGTFAGSRALQLRPGPPATARIERRTVVADGAREASLRVVVQDRHGNPVSATPTLAAARGRVLEVALDGDGAYRARYLAPAVERRGEDRLTLAVGGVRAQGTVMLVPPRGREALILSAGAAFGRGGAVGPRAAVALERDAAREVAGLGVSWRLDAEWTRLSRVAESEAGSSHVSTAGSLLAGASVRRELGATTVWASAGAGVVLERSRPGGSGAAPAGRLALGVGWLQREGMPFVEASALGADRGALPSFGLSVGVRIGRKERHGDDPHRR